MKESLNYISCMQGLCKGKPTTKNSLMRWSASILGTWNSWWEYPYCYHPVYPSLFFLTSNLSVQKDGFLSDKYFLVWQGEVLDSKVCNWLSNIQWSAKITMEPKNDSEQGNPNIEYISINVDVRSTRVFEAWWEIHYPIPPKCPTWRSTILVVILHTLYYSEGPLGIRIVDPFWWVFYLFPWE